MAGTRPSRSAGRRDTRASPSSRSGPGFRRQAAGSGCGCLIVLIAGAVLGPMWLGLVRLGAGVPTPGDLVTTGPPHGAGWLVAGTLVAVPVCAAPLPLMFFSAMAFDAVSGGRLPRRASLVGLYVALPVLGLVMIVCGWICYAADVTDAARFLGLGPWAAGLGVIAVTALLWSAAVAYENR